MMRTQLYTILIVTVAVGAVSTAIIASGLLWGSNTITNGGTVKAIGVGVYWESSCVNNVTSINWGYLAPGDNREITVYIRNEGNVPMTLNMTTGSWTPTSAPTFIALGWDREGSQVEAGEVVETTLDLSVSPDIHGISSFSFEITIVGIE